MAFNKHPKRELARRMTTGSDRMMHTPVFDTPAWKRRADSRKARGQKKTEMRSTLRRGSSATQDSFKPKRGLKDFEKASVVPKSRAIGRGFLRNIFRNIPN